MNIYIWKDVPVVTTPGIYHSAEDGLISLSSDGTTWYTISDKNLGATVVYNDGDTLSESNCGKYYQRGNNYGFPFTGPTTTSTTKVNAGSYGPGNYYNSSTFIVHNANPSYWDSSYNSNLRGGTTGTNTAMKGPCDEGWHIPSNSDYSTLYNILSSLGALDIAYLKIAKGGMISFDGNIAGQGSYTYLWTTTAYNNYQSYDISSNLYSSHYAWKTMGFPIRPFKNESVQPTSDWTVLYQPS